MSIYRSLSYSVLHTTQLYQYHVQYCTIIMLLFTVDKICQNLACNELLCLEVCEDEDYV